MAAVLLRLVFLSADVVASTTSTPRRCPEPYEPVALLLDYQYNGSSEPRNFTVCEDFSGGANSTVLFVDVTEGGGGRVRQNITVAKRLVPQLVPDEASYLGFGKARVLKARTDLLGAALLSKPGGFNLADVTAAIPPIRDLNHPCVDAPCAPPGFGIPWPHLSALAERCSVLGVTICAAARHVIAGTRLPPR